MQNLKGMIVGHRYTIAGFSLTGRPYSRSFRIVSIKDIGPGNYQDAFILTVKFGVCRHSLIRLTDADRFLIWDGVVNVTMKEKAEWQLMDPKYLQLAKQGVKKPMFEN